MKVRFTEPADKDITRALADSARLFGRQQAWRYLEIIKAGIVALADEPRRPTSKARDEIGNGVRSFHLQLAAKKQGGASHIVYYRVFDTPAQSAELVILRVLPDRMDPARRVRTVLNAAKKN